MTVADEVGPRSRLARAAIGLATALALVGLTIALFFNPLWVGFEQARARADLYTGWTAGQVRSVTESIVGEVYFGPGTFRQEVDGAAVFDERERAHMADVRTVLLVFDALVVLAAALLVATWLRNRGRRWLWQAVAAGAAALAVGAAIVGAAFLVFFDAAFELFHRLFFAGGTYTFDPGTERLVQLFPYQFWTETSVAIAAGGLVLTWLTWRLARRRAARVQVPIAGHPAVAVGRSGDPAQVPPT